MGRKRKPDPEKYCHKCGDRMERTRWPSGELETFSSFMKSKFCSRKCTFEAASAKTQETLARRDAGLTSERLHELLSYDPETGILRWRRSGSSSPAVDAVAGNKDKYGYLRVSIDRRRYRVHTIIWLMTHGAWPKILIDHINGCPSDNRLANLREASRSQNVGNSKCSKRSKSGRKGVSWNRQSEKWQVFIMENGKNKNLGMFDDIDEAAAAYAAAATKKFGEFARFS